MRRAGSASRRQGRRTTSGPTRSSSSRPAPSSAGASLDTGGAWQVAHSGRTIAATGQWAEMLAGAGEDWEVLVVGYVSRFARDLRTAVNARHDLHARGAVILFADERVLSSDEDEWERWAREAVEAEAYSRRLAKRIREGYAAKRRRLGVPGGNRAPLGTVRRGRTIAVDEAAMAIVRRVYELAAGGPHRPRGRRGDGPRPQARRRDADQPLLRRPPPVGRAVRPGRPRRPAAPGSTSRRCGRGTAAGTAEGSTAASTASAGCWPARPAAAGSSATSGGTGTSTPARRSRPPPRAGIQRDGETIDPRVRGESYKVEVYEDAIGRAFEHVAVSSTLKASTVADRAATGTRRRR